MQKRNLTDELLIAVQLVSDVVQVNIFRGLFVVEGSALAGILSTCRV